MLDPDQMCKAIEASMRVKAFPPGSRSNAGGLIFSTSAADYVLVVNLDDLTWEMAPPEQRALMNRMK